MTTNKEFPGDFNLLEVNLYHFKENSKPVDIRELVNEIILTESLNESQLRAELHISDVGENIISNYPLFGQEKVEIILGTKTKNYKLIYYIYKIDNRYLRERNQIYTIHLISYEGIKNEITRVSERIDGIKVENALSNYIKNKLKSQKKLFYDTTLYNANLIVPNWRIFDFANWIKKRSVSDKYPDSMGYLFYETFEGFNFKSIDVLINQTPVNNNQPYTYVQANITNNPIIESYRIKSFSSPKVVDIFENSRLGSLCHTEIQLDFDHRRVNIEKRSIENFYSKTSHLGNTKPYSTKTDFNLHTNPSRIVYRPLLNNIWNTNNNNNIDKFNDQFSKAVFRYNFLEYNKLNITISGNMDIRVGQVLKISIPSPEVTSNNTRVIDKRLSGNYLINTIRHSLLERTYINTEIELIRDSFG